MRVTNISIISKLYQYCIYQYFGFFQKYTNMALPILFIGKLKNTNIFEILVNFFEYW